MKKIQTLFKKIILFGCIQFAISEHICLPSHMLLGKCNDLGRKSSKQRSVQKAGNSSFTFEKIKIWREWWFEWNNPGPDALDTEPEADVIKLCMGKKKRFTTCKEHNISKRACVGTKDGKTGKCSTFKDIEIPVPICTEKSSWKLITCEYKAAFHCFPKNQTATPIQPCRFKDRLACLIKDGSLHKCKNSTVRNSVDKAVEFKKEGNTVFEKVKKWREWWFDWNNPSPGDSESVPENKVINLCIAKKNRFANCKKNMLRKKACVGGTNGNIKYCTDFKESVIAVPICAEANSRKVTTCGDFKKAFLCIPDATKTSPIRPCRDKNRRLCIGINGGLKACKDLTSMSRLKDRLRDAFPVINGNKKWVEWWTEWTKPSENKEKPENETIYLCKPESGKDNLIDCKANGNNKTEACVSAFKDTISTCNDFVESDMAIPICRERKSNRTHTCRPRFYAFLCSPASENNEIYPIRPCRNQNRFLCSSENGLVQKCDALLKNLKRYNAYNISKGVNTIHAEQYYYNTLQQSWKRFHVNITKDEMMHPEVQKRELCKPKGNNMVLVECHKDITATKACIGVIYGKISECEKYSGVDMPVPICKEKSTERVVTCGKVEPTPAYLCFSDGDVRAPIKPCFSASGQICLVGRTEKKLELCPEPQDKAISNIHEKTTLPVCLRKGSIQVIPCHEYGSNDFACLNAKSGNVETCQTMQLNNGTGLQLCTQNETNYLISCGKFNRVNLCEISSKWLYIIQACKKRNLFLCLVDGTLRTCSETSFEKEWSRTGNIQSLNNQSKNAVYKSDKNAIANTKLESTRLCKQKGNSLKKCDDDEEINFACLGPRHGVVRRCDNFKETGLVTPICVEDKTNALVTCETFTRRNLCEIASSWPYNIQACKKHISFLCVIGGTIKRCFETALEDTFLRNGNIKSLDYQNTEDVYKSEKTSIKNIMLDSHRLCRHEDDNLKKCDDDWEIAFACLGARYGEVNKCENFNETELVIPICVEAKTKRVVTCGKFFKANLCYPQGKNELPVETCEDAKRRLCLSEKGSLNMCVDKEFLNIEFALPSLYLANNIRQNDPSKINLSDGRNEKYIFEVNEVMEDGKLGKFDEDRRKKYFKDKYTVVEGKIIHEANSDESKKSGYSEDREYEDYGGQNSFYFKLEHHDIMKKKLNALISEIHSTSQHLCAHNDEPDKLVNCDDSKIQYMFMCVGAKTGEIKPCFEFKGNNIAFPICLQVQTNTIVTCDIFSNVALCFPQKGKTGRYLPCKIPSRFICLGRYGAPTKCSKTAVARKHFPESSTDEKFFRFHCNNCSIENKLVVIGNPDDVLPEIETFTFPK